MSETTRQPRYRYFRLKKIHRKEFEAGIKKFYKYKARLINEKIKRCKDEVRRKKLEVDYDEYKECVDLGLGAFFYESHFDYPSKSKFYEYVIDRSDKWLFKELNDCIKYVHREHIRVIKQKYKRSEQDNKPLDEIERALEKAEEKQNRGFEYYLTEVFPNVEELDEQFLMDEDFDDEESSDEESEEEEKPVVTCSKRIIINKNYTIKAHPQVINYEEEEEEHVPIAEKEEEPKVFDVKFDEEEDEFDRLLLEKQKSLREREERMMQNQRRLDDEIQNLCSDSDIISESASEESPPPVRKRIGGLRIRKPQPKMPQL